MLSLVDKNPIMETNPQKLMNNNTQEAAELLGLSSSDSLDSPSFSHFQAPKQKRKVRFKKPFRPSSRLKSSRSTSSKSCKCSFMEGLKIFSYFAVLAIVGALLWYVMTLSTRIEELQAKFSDFEAGNRNTPEALHVIHSSLKQLDSNVTMLYIDARKSIADIENITSEVKLLKETANSLRASIASAPAIQQLPKDMHSLSESVANFGSKLNALESNVKELKDQQSNLQTTCQNLSGELDTVKISIQDITNSTDYQAKSSVNTSVKDSKLQNAIQEANQHVETLQGQLTDVVKSVEKINTTFRNQLNIYSELPAKVETVKEAIVWLNNTTLTHSSRISALETFVHSNLTLRLDQLEPDRPHSFQMPAAADIGDYVNKTISEAILQMINKGIFHSGIQNTNNNAMQSLDQTHDVLVLLASLLQKFDQLPTTYILTNKNSSEIVESMLYHAFEELIGSRDFKIENLDQELKNLSLCIPSCHSTEVATDGHLDDTTTPVFLKSTLKTGNSQNDNPQFQLAEALG
ncbi:unnamed protein product [Larinioides sclopetarius]|uniref:Uncharacterized protein n=2 Tax=Larinioides sclopetarius TaxID=280406 RepID=A0AAV2BCB5_9ARAC